MAATFPLLTDYHVHTPLCGHAEGSPLEYVAAARAAGLAEIGFSDHNPMPTQFDEWRMGPDQLPLYLEMIEEARRATTDIPIRLGLECDFIPGYEDHLKRQTQAADWDYLIGSVHYIAPGWDVDNPVHLKRFTERPVEEIWDLYFKAYAQMARSGLFDFLAHPDLVKKFGHRPGGDLSRFYTETLDIVAASGVAIEINTAGLRKEVKEIYPSRQFLDLAFQKGIPVLINSDAHKPTEIAHAFGEALALIKDVGYKSVVRFEKRKRYEVAI